MFHAIALIHSRCQRIQEVETQRTGRPKVPAILPAPHAIFNRLVAELRSIGLGDCVKLNAKDDVTRSYCMVPLWEINPDDGLGERSVEVFPRHDEIWND